jgi:hypothetical protein
MRRILQAARRRGLVAASRREPRNAEQNDQVGLFAEFPKMLSRVRHSPYG